MLFNNIDQELSLFSALGRLGVRFEDLGLIVPPAPDGTSRRSFYSYRLAEPGEPFAAVAAGRLICSVPEAVVPAGSARLAARIWLAVRRARPPHGTGAPLEDGDFLLRIAVCGLGPARNVKAVVDGATAAMQRDDPDRVSDAITRLSALLGVDAEGLLALATAVDAPLGSRSRSSPTSKGDYEHRGTLASAFCVAISYSISASWPRLSRRYLQPARGVHGVAAAGVLSAFRCGVDTLPGAMSPHSAVTPHKAPCR